MIRIATRAELQQTVNFAVRLNSRPEHRCKAFHDSHDNIHAQFERMLDHPHDKILVQEEQGRITGVLAILVEPEDKYIEAIGGVFAERNYGPVATEFFNCLRENYPGHQMHAAYPEENEQAICFMNSIGAELEDYDYELRLKRAAFRGGAGHENTAQLTEQYYAGFSEFHNHHNPDVFWTGEKLLDALDKFRIHIAIENKTIVGAVVTSKQTEPEIFFLTLAEHHQVLRYGKPLLLHAAKSAYCDGAEEILSMVDKKRSDLLITFEEVGFKRTDTCLSYKIYL